MLCRREMIEGMVEEAQHQPGVELFEFCAAEVKTSAEIVSIKPATIEIAVNIFFIR